MLRRVLAVLAGLVALFVALALLAIFALERTVPRGSETREVQGLEAAATVSVDAAGVPVLRASTLNDIAFLSGWAHARDRRFQMELQRRSASGRLAELVGRAALPADRRIRTFGFVHVADSALDRMEPARRAMFEAYAAGVNAWDGAHPAPPEFAVLRVPREPWRARDCLLTVLLMFEQLNDVGEQEREVERMDLHLPRSLVAFLLPDSTPYDAPVVAGRMPPLPALPAPADVDVRAPRAAIGWVRGAALAALEADERAAGSNNWVIAPSRSATGGAILAGDPHLGLRVPVIWHRQRLEGAGLAITGITLPGAPGVIAGSNGRVAWSMTNVEPDASDLVRLVPADPETTSWLGPHGPEPFHVRVEIIPIQGGSAETLRVRESRFGPVVGPSARGGLLALQWTALDPWMLDFDLFGIDRAGSVRELLAALNAFRGPPQNWVAADREGHIGWTIGGFLPRRVGFDPRRPRDGADGAAHWAGYLGADSLPHAFDPPEGFIATANQRTLGAAWTRTVTGCGYAFPWRARRIHDALAARARWSVDDVAALQNDLADGFLDPVAAALDRALTPEACAANDTLARVRRLLATWNHRADSSSAAHGYLRYARLEINRASQAPLIAPCVAADSGFSYGWPLADEVTRRLLAERPAHLLDPAYRDWDELARAAAIRAAAQYGAAVPGGAPFDSLPWGRVNRAAINHPLGDAVPVLDRWLDMPHVALSGGSFVVRVARPRAGASMRLVADLANPRNSRFVIPGGQSGNFLSPHYGDLFGDWVAGRMVPLEPGPARIVYRLTPAHR